MSFATSFADILVQQPNVAVMRPSAIVMSALTLTTGSISQLALLARHRGS